MLSSWPPRDRAEAGSAAEAGCKFAAYRTLDSLSEYLLIDSRRRALEVFRRQSDGWLLTPVETGHAGRLDLALRSKGQVYLFEFKVFDLAPEGHEWLLQVDQPRSPY